MTKISFHKSKKLNRNWGDEVVLGIVSKKFSLKKLIMKAGTKGGLQYHRKKNEFAYLHSGQLLLRYESTKGTLIEKKIKEGESFHIPPLSIHQEEAITDCIIFEVSTPHFNDRVRVESKFDIAEENGLPTTKEKDIQEY